MTIDLPKDNPLLLDPKKVFATNSDMGLVQLVNLPQIKNMLGEQALLWKSGGIRTLLVCTLEAGNDDLNIQFVQKQQIVPVTMDDVNKFRASLKETDEELKLEGKISSPFDYSEMTEDQTECLRVCETITGIINADPNWKMSESMKTIQMCLSILFSLHHTEDVILLFVGDVSSATNYVRPVRLSVIANVNDIDNLIATTDARTAVENADEGVEVNTEEDEAGDADDKKLPWDSLS